MVLTKLGKECEVLYKICRTMYIVRISLRTKGFFLKVVRISKNMQKNKKTTLIVGAGEVGSSLAEVLRPYYEVVLLDKEDQDISEGIEVMNICFGYSDDFVSEVKRYQEKYKPRYTVIHSTVPVGTSRQCDAIHSPIIGIHPYLQEGIKTFIKFLSGEKASEVAHFFKRAGLKLYLFDKPETTELLKVLDTTFYGLCIEYTKEIKRLCDEHGLPFEAWTLYNDNYNKGYQKLGYPEYTRPNLVPIMTEIKGHCVVPNTFFLENEFTKLIQKLNVEARDK